MCIYICTHIRKLLLCDDNMVYMYLQRAQQNVFTAHSFQESLAKEYALNHNLIPYMIQSIFLNEGLLEALGVTGRS